MKNFNHILAISFLCLATMACNQKKNKGGNELIKNLHLSSLDYSYNYKEIDMRYAGIKSYQSKCVSDYDVYLNEDKSLLVVRSLVEVDDPTDSTRKADCRYAVATNVKKLKEGFINFSNSKIFLEIGWFVTRATPEQCKKISRKEILNGILKSAYDGEHHFTHNYIRELSDDHIIFGLPGEKVTSDCNEYVHGYWTPERLTGKVD